MNVLCIDIGATRIKWAVLPAIQSQEQLTHVRVSTMRSVGWRNANLKNLLDANTWNSITHVDRRLPPFDTVAVSLCGEVHPESQAVGGYLVTQRGVGADLKASFGRRVGKPVILMNDGEAWARGAVTWCRLSSRPIELPALALIFGTGVGFAIVERDGKLYPREFGHPFKGEHLARAADRERLVNPWDVHGILGKEFFDWVDKVRVDWVYEKIRTEFTVRVIGLIQDVCDVFGRPATLLIGGGNAEYASQRRIVDKCGMSIVTFRDDQLNINPDLIPLIGCRGAFE